MRNAYMIMAHHNFSQLNLLLRLLDDADNDIYLHIDEKSGALDQGLLVHGVERSKVIFVPRMRITWGGVSQILCEMELLEAALADGHHDYYHLLSGDDLPIKSNAQIAAFLDVHAGVEFVGISLVGRPEELPQETVARVSIWHPWRDSLPGGGRKMSPQKVIERYLEEVQKLLHVNRLKGKEVMLAKGSNWFSITEAFASYVLERGREQMGLFESSFCVDELFVQTLLINSPFRKHLWRETTHDSNAAALRLIDWKRGNPWIFRNGDIGMIRESDCLFARKFDMDVDAEIINQVAHCIHQ